MRSGWKVNLPAGYGSQNHSQSSIQSQNSEFCNDSQAYQATEDYEPHQHPTPGRPDTLTVPIDSESYPVFYSQALDADDSKHQQTPSPDVDIEYEKIPSLFESMINPDFDDDMMSDDVENVDDFELDSLNVQANKIFLKQNESCNNDQFTYETTPPSQFTTMIEGTDLNAKLPHMLHFAVMTFVLAADLSTTQYRMFTEIVDLIVDNPSAAKALPRSLASLKKTTRGAMPLCTIKSTFIDIDQTKTPPKPRSNIKAYHFDIQEYTERWINDKAINKHLYYGFAQCSNVVTEFYHGEQWAESVLATSGQFATIVEAVGNQRVKVPLLPSDCILYNHQDTRTRRFGRIAGVWLDKRPGVSYDSIILTINPLYTPRQIDNLFTRFETVADNTKSEYESQNMKYLLQYERHVNNSLKELILSTDTEIVCLKNVIKRIWVLLSDYRLPASSPEMQRSLLPVFPEYGVRHIAYLTPDGAGLREVHLRKRITAENEIYYHGREWIYEHILGIKGSQKLPLRYIPYTMFLDDFGLYRRTYNSLAGYYICPANLPYVEREKLINQFVIMLGPFGSDKVTLAECLQSDFRRMHVPIESSSGLPIRLLVMPIAVLGDMPQQNSNAGCKGPTADCPCRFCLVKQELLHDQTFDISQHGRYQQSMVQTRLNIKTIRSSNDREKAYRMVGLLDRIPTFSHCFPLLDPYCGFPIDPFHCELRLASYTHACLIETMLNTAGKLQYQRIWETCALPYGWSVPQNPISHKGSYTFAENGRLAVLQPLILLNMFLSDPDGDQFLLPAAHATLTEEFGNAVNGLLETTYCAAKSIHA
ncbi:hypothetical protein EDC01DRAFT_637031 [Geopyxis carbonaria]|nr:hypothetical protein EDC01DRAFT_637031 [Geopyxis carbonaria]